VAYPNILDVLVAEGREAAIDQIRQRHVDVATDLLKTQPDLPEGDRDFIVRRLVVIDLIKDINAGQPDPMAGFNIIV